jgi:hypothetical protein
MKAIDAIRLFVKSDVMILGCYIPEKEVSLNIGNENEP